VSARFPAGSPACAQRGGGAKLTCILVGAPVFTRSRLESALGSVSFALCVLLLVPPVLVPCTMLGVSCFEA